MSSDEDKYKYLMDSGLIFTLDGEIKYEIRHSGKHYELELGSEIIILGSEENEFIIRNVGNKLNKFKKIGEHFSTEGIKKDIKNLLTKNPAS